MVYWFVIVVAVIFWWIACMNGCHVEHYNRWAGFSLRVQSSPRSPCQLAQVTQQGRSFFYKLECNTICCIVAWLPSLVWVLSLRVVILLSGAVASPGCYDRRCPAHEGDKGKPVFKTPNMGEHVWLPSSSRQIGTDCALYALLKVPVIAESLKKAILKEHKAASEATYGVSTVLSSASATCRSRSEGLLSLLNEESSYNILKFEIGCVTCLTAF